MGRVKTRDKKMTIPEPLKAAVLEALRVIVLAVIPVVIYQLEQETFDWKVVAVIAAITALRFGDKWLHKYGEELERESLSKGLTRF